ncbi:hypothetical protein Q5P01_004342 [Channa striata]|uniref:USP domain-containing protein n=1 Tax=Channa striata TaxID=64152 RepID=A0AA88NL74_CHASR|nr:hypothetical protein Q5P01_004342 [Channa striata]
MTELSKVRRIRRRRKLFNLCRRKHIVALLQRVKRDKRTHQTVHESRYCAGSKDENIQLTIRLNASTINVQRWLLGDNMHSSCANDSQQSLGDETQLDDSQELVHQDIWLGDFISDVSFEEEAWGSVPGAELIRTFMDIVRCHHSVDLLHKLQVLFSFKDVISADAHEFQDNSQKDAHEFLTSVLDQMRNSTPVLSQTAAMIGATYSCPIREHLSFMMQNTRTCNSCGLSSVRYEDFTNLSLNLLPGASVQEMLQDYLKETELEYRCDCGANTSRQQYDFVTLPKVLILHIKRFHFTSFFHLVKLSHPIILFRELMVTSSQTNGWYSLVSVISHLGNGGHTGHYVSDGLHPEADVYDPGDYWLSYNDLIVTETTGAAVCINRKKTAYILFYQRQVREQSSDPAVKPVLPSPKKNTNFYCFVTDIGQPEDKGL